MLLVGASFGTMRLFFFYKCSRISPVGKRISQKHRETDKCYRWCINKKLASLSVSHAF